MCVAYAGLTLVGDDVPSLLGTPPDPKRRTPPF